MEEKNWKTMESQNENIQRKLRKIQLHKYSWQQTARNDRLFATHPWFDGGGQMNTLKKILDFFAWLLTLLLQATLGMVAGMFAVGIG
ncbi:MAG: hypothetical protein ABIJ65_06525 [Chloroflexota bacterium]